MEALKHLAVNIPDWLKRLEVIDGQIEQRQKYFATAPAAEQPTPGSPSKPQSPSAIVRRTSQARAFGRAWAIRKRKRSDSVNSTKRVAAKHRSRGIVYYDSYVQLFFEDLVKFVSASRNMTRKVKMAAKVAQIKRPAELERFEESDEEGAESISSIADSAIAPRKTISTAMNDGQAWALEKDIYDDLDKGLEYIQSMCEHAAHQFLQGGECAEEVGNISGRMVKTKELAEGELERVQREEPDAFFKAAEEESRGRSYRPPSMRKDLTSSGSHRSDPNTNETALDADINTAGGDAKSYKHPPGFRPILVSLWILLYLGDIVVLTVEAQSRGELPDATASISISIFALTSAVQLENLATLEKVELSVSCIYLGCWVLLDALASGADPWWPLVVVIAVDVLDTVSSYAVKFLWIDVSLQRASPSGMPIGSSCWGTNGKIMEYGTHDELVAKNGEYTKLWKMHTGENIGETGDLIDVLA
ncbi:hypothetical protein OQA88_7351 [Cercophora sp. LCS_1]